MNALTWLKGAGVWVAVIAALCASLLLQRAQLAGAVAELATEQASRAAENADRNRVALRWSERVAALQLNHATVQQENVNAYNTERSARQAAESGERAADLSLRGVIAAYAARDRVRGANDAAAAGDLGDRSERLGALLQESVDLARQGESLVRKRDGQVTLLLRTVANDRALCDAAATP